MRIHKQFFKSLAFTTLLFTGFTAGSMAQDTTTMINQENEAPTILSISPIGGEMNVDLGSDIQITFSTDMDEGSINGNTLMLHANSTDTMDGEHGDMMLEDQIRDRSVIKDSKNNWQSSMGAVSGTISYSDRVAVFTPDQKLKENTEYTFIVTSEVKSEDSVPLEKDEKWSFTTIGSSDSNYNDEQNARYRSGMGETENMGMAMQASSATTSKMIELGKAGHYVILAKKDVNNESGSDITGHIGEGSAANKTQKEKDGQQSTSGLNSQTQSSQRDTSSSDITEGIQHMMSAFADAAMQNGNDLTSHENESINNIELTAGVHEWDDSLQIGSDVTLSGSADDVWLFKVSNNLTVDENVVFTLTNGAKADNIFWYVEGDVTIGENAQFEGIILSMNDITLEKGAQLNGRMFSQASITLDDNTVTEPRNMAGQTSSSNRDE